MTGRQLIVRLLDCDLAPLATWSTEEKIHNADTTLPLFVQATVICDLGEEHGVGKMQLRPWPGVREGP